MTSAAAYEDLAARIERYRPLVIAELRAVVGDDPRGLYAWMRYHLGWEDAAGRVEEAAAGKMLRSTALLLAAELVGGRVEDAVPAAAAVDLVHNFSLLHDDIEDNSAARRGRDTVWTFAGVPQAINTGDGMFTLAHLAMHRLPAVAALPDRAVEAMRELDTACIRLVEGQYLDMDFERRDDVTRAEYETMIAGKTAAMFAAPFAMGALLGGARLEVVQGFRAYGRHIGLAFQALDDILDCWGTREALGKEPGGDLLARKKTYPILAAIEAGDAALAEAYRHPAAPGEDYRVLAAQVEAAGGRAATEAWARAQLDAAHAALSASGLDPTSLGVLYAYSRAATGM